MLASRRPFDDEEVTGVMARVLERDPEWTLLPRPAAGAALADRAVPRERSEGAAARTSATRATRSTR
jgi:hypothetical protein